MQERVDVGCHLPTAPATNVCGDTFSVFDVSERDPAPSARFVARRPPGTALVLVLKNNETPRLTTRRTRTNLCSDPCRAARACRDLWLDRRTSRTPAACAHGRTCPSS